MNQIPENRIESTLIDLFKESKGDNMKIMKSASRNIFRPMQPSDFKNIYLSISKKQGEDLQQLIIDKDLKNIVEFGTSFGISTLYLAQGILKTGGQIVTTELIESKAQRAINNFQAAGVKHFIDVRIGNALETLANYSEAIDLLFLDGWKDLYLSIFEMLETNFHQESIIYVDNADMAEVHTFIQEVRKKPNYHFKTLYSGKVVLITKINNI